MTSWTVVIFGSPAGGEWCDLNHCPMEAVGLFESYDKATEEAARYPDAFRPHVLLWHEQGLSEYPWQEKLTEEETCD